MATKFYTQEAGIALLNSIEDEVIALIQSRLTGHCAGPEAIYCVIAILMRGARDVARLGGEKMFSDMYKMNLEALRVDLARDKAERSKGDTA